MESFNYNKNFLDTSVMRSMLLGVNAYKEYYRKEFKDKNLYVSKFVLMEFKRSFIRKILDFYFLLTLSSISTIGEAIQLWQNKFSGSDLKAVLSFIAQYLDSHPYDQNSSADKEKALNKISSVIKRLIVKSKIEFKTIGTNSTRCRRSLIDIPNNGTNAERFRNFLEKFNDSKFCQKDCKIAHFFLMRYRSEIENFILQSKGIAQNSETEGFFKIMSKLQDILDSKGAICTCKFCEGIGDAVIALEAPREMELEHTDNSFDYFCPIINQPHRKHPSEVTFVKSLG